MYVWDVVVLTDGADHHSTVHTGESVAAKLAAPGVANFHAIFMGVGLWADTEAVVRDICVGGGCTYLPVGANVPAIENAFREVAARVQAHRIQVIGEVCSAGVGALAGVADGMDVSMLLRVLAFGVCGVGEGEGEGEGEGAFCGSGSPECVGRKGVEQGWSCSVFTVLNVFFLVCVGLYRVCFL